MIEQLIEIIDKGKKRSGMTNAELARKAGVTYRQLLNIQNGRNTSLVTIEKIMVALNIKELKLKI